MEKYFNKLGAPKALASDFAWIVSCAELNAEYGYGVSELFNSNACVRDLVRYYGLDKIKPVIDALGYIGWAICSEDDSEIKKAKKEFEKVFKVWNESLKSE